MTSKQALLWPLTVPYGAAARLRARAYAMGLLKPEHLNARVISVGNLTVGGTGKTPMVLWIAKHLLDEGKAAGILTRGYRGTKSPDGATSDEVELLKARLGERIAIGVGPDRYAHGMELIERGVEWIILDDGFQHLRLARDANVVLIDATNPFGGGRLLPAGRMREPKTALARSDVIVITRSNHAPAVEAAVRRETNVAIFYARTRLDCVCSLRRDEPGEPLSNARDRRWFVFCGIGNPDAFLADLRDWGFQLAGSRFFRDHHRYTQADIDEVVTEARSTGADGLLCTEKDRFNLEAVASLAMETAYCQIFLHLERAQEFWSEVETMVAISQSKKKVR